MKSWPGAAVADRVARSMLAIGLLGAATVVGASIVRDAQPVVAAQGDIASIAPGRYVDTRVGEATIDGEFAGTGRVAAGTEFVIKIAGRTRIPTDAAAVMMNVTAVRPAAPGHITVYPCGTPRPNVSNLNYNGDDVVPNAVLAKIGTGGSVCVFSLATTDLVVDVNAYVPDGGSPRPLNPVRHVDTRTASPGGSGDNPGRLTGGKEYKFTIAGRSGVPTDAEGAMMNVTAVRPSGPGFVSVYPCGASRPIVSSINYNGDDVAPNAVLAKFGPQGRICVYSLRDTDLIIDINGFVPADGVPIPVDPVRFADTRPGQATIDGREAGTGRLVAGREYKFTVGGRPGHPGYDTMAAMMNITAVRPDGPGHITVYPCGTSRPIVSSINYRGDDVVPNAVYSEIGENGQICVVSVSTTDLIIDVNAFVPTGDGPGPVTTTTQVPEPCVIDGTDVDTEIPGQECDALIELYASTDGESWRDTDGWNSPTDPCGWHGVSCGDGHVDVVSLRNNYLTGSFPTSVIELPNLRILILGENNLQGPVPASIGSLTKLEKLNLELNALSGPIPNSIGTLSSLGVIQLAYNSFSGPIPNTIGNLTELGFLDLTGNKLSGSVPSSIGNLSELGTLWVGQNQLTGTLPSSMANLSKLETVSFNDNELSGPIPDVLGGLTALFTIDLGGNTFSGTIPSWIGNLTELSFLDLGRNQLNKRIPDSIGNLTSMDRLDLGFNRLSGAIPTSMVNLGNPSSVILAGNDCFTAIDPDLLVWLNREDPAWNGGC